MFCSVYSAFTWNRGMSKNREMKKTVRLRLQVKERHSLESRYFADRRQWLGFHKLFKEFFCRKTSQNFQKFFNNFQKFKKLGETLGRGMSKDETQTILQMP